MGTIGQLAGALGAPERTVRRAVATGSIRSRRLSQRRLRLAEGELAYLRRNWGLLTELRSALRTEQHVRVAILAGSMARGDDHGLSDIDLVVGLDSDQALDRLKLAMRLREKLGREVDVANLEQVLDDPLSLLQVLDEGRVIVDRVDLWQELNGRRAAIRKRAARSYRQQQERLATSLASQR